MPMPPVPIGRMGALALALAVGVGGVAPVRADPANTLEELWSVVRGCATLDGVTPGSLGSEVTVRFSLKRDGSLLGQPRITHSSLLGDRADQQSFLAAALGAVSRCLPVSITDGLGGAIAGRPLSIRLTSKKPERAL